MAIYRISGKSLLPEPGSVGTSTLASGPKPAVSLAGELRSGGVAGIQGFKPIGIGKPLLVMIRHVYTGQFPKRSWFSGGEGDVAIVSGVKDFDVFAASARALNTVKLGHPSHAAVDDDAFSQGTSIVSYTPSLLKSEIKITVEIATATFPKETVDSLAKGFQSLAGIPLMLPYLGYLMAAGELLRISGDWVASLYNHPVFSVTEKLTFDLAGAVPAAAGFRLLANDSFDAQAFEYIDGRGLVDSVTGKPYAGDEPYVVISADGTEQPGLNGFASTVASADVLGRFFRSSSQTQTSIEAITQGMQLLSDMRYRDEAMKVEAHLRKANDRDEQAKLKAKWESLIKNIGSDALRPAALS